MEEVKNSQELPDNAYTYLNLAEQGKAKNPLHQKARAEAQNTNTTLS